MARQRPVPYAYILCARHVRRSRGYSAAPRDSSAVLLSFVAARELLAADMRDQREAAFQHADRACFI